MSFFELWWVACVLFGPIIKFDIIGPLLSKCRFLELSSQQPLNENYVAAVRYEKEQLIVHIT